MWKKWLFPQLLIITIGIVKFFSLCSSNTKSKVYLLSGTTLTASVNLLLEWANTNQRTWRAMTSPRSRTTPASWPSTPITRAAAARARSRGSMTPWSRGGRSWPRTSCGLSSASVWSLDTGALLKSLIHGCELQCLYHKSLYWGADSILILSIVTVTYVMLCYLLCLKCIQYFDCWYICTVISDALENPKIELIPET